MAGKISITGILLTAPAVETAVAMGFQREEGEQLSPRRELWSVEHFEIEGN